MDTGCNMPCYHPIPAWYKRGGVNPATGKNYITFKQEEACNEIAKAFLVPCGRCIGCRLEHSRQWAIRISHEAALHVHSSFLTLTYNPEHVPRDGSLNKRDIQLFFKRLRKAGYEFRYYQCGEYGEQFGRPHHHVCIFGLDFSFDRVYYKRISGNRYYKSDTLNKIWGLGDCVITDLTFETAAYTARYCTKKITGDVAADHYKGKLPEYATMSRKTGIGKEYYQRFKSDIIVGDSVIIRKDVIVKPAKYYDKLYDLEDTIKFKEVKKKREQQVLEKEVEDPRRRAVKEEIKRHKLSKNLKRSYENGNENL